ncbi:MAG: PilN domain-containing protein, partial [Desulfonatronovibrionaceae bacterium]
PGRLYVLQSRLGMDQLASRLNISPEEVIRLESGDNQDIAPENKAQGYEIPLLPRTIIRRQAMARYILYGAIVFFGLSILALPFAKLAGQKRHLTKIENQVRKMRANAEELTRLREESRQIMESIESMAEMRSSYPSVVNILRGLTEAVPENAWVISLRYSDRGLTIQGEAESSSSVIEALENSPMFREVRLSSPVTRSGSREKFTLEAEVVI